MAKLCLKVSIFINKKTLCKDSIKLCIVIESG